MWPYIIGAIGGGIIAVFLIWLVLVTSTTYH